MSSWLSKATGTGRQKSSWHDIEEYTDKSTGITYKTRGYKKKKRFGGSRKKRTRSEIAAKGLGSQDYKVFKSSGGGKDGAIRVGTYGNKLPKGPGSAGGADMSTSAAQYQTKIRQKTGGSDVWAVKDFIKDIKSKERSRWNPGKGFDIDDQESVRNWIEGLGAGATSEGKLQKDWFTNKAEKFRQGIDESGDVVKVAGKKSGEDFGEFMSQSQGLAQSLLPKGAAQEAGGDFLSMILSNEGGGITNLMDTLQSKLDMYDKKNLENLRTMKESGRGMTAETYQDIEKEKAGYYRSGRTSGIIEDLLSDLTQKNKEATSVFAQSQSDLWGSEIGQSLYDAQGLLKGN